MRAPERRESFGPTALGGQPPTTPETNKEPAAEPLVPAPRAFRGFEGSPLRARTGLRYSPIVLFALLYVVVRFMLEALIVRGQSGARLRAEVLALRHQLGVLERQIDRTRWQPADRLVLAAISRVLPRPDWRSLLPRPETLLRWHRELVRHK